MDGRIALLEAVDAMNKSKKENIKFSEMEIVKNIEKYNYVDVKVIDEIIDFLRTKLYPLILKFFLYLLSYLL